MLKSQKSQLTCSYCSKIFKDPILLPCGDSICREHLSERDIVKANRIKCMQWNEEFQVKSNEFKSNDELKNSIDNQSYLSVEELSLKQALEESIRQFLQFCDEFKINQNSIRSYSRFKIDEHREELKKRIDDIALEMIDKIKKYEDSFSNSLKERFSSVYDSQSLGNKQNEKEEKFRNPNLLIESIKAIQRNQEESLRDVQLKLNQMNQVNDQLKATNQFKPNLYFFNQKQKTSFFGLIK